MGSEILECLVPSAGRDTVSAKSQNMVAWNESTLHRNINWSSFHPVNEVVPLSCGCVGACSTFLGSNLDDWINVNGSVWWMIPGRNPSQKSTDVRFVVNSLVMVTMVGTCSDIPWFMGERVAIFTQSLRQQRDSRSSQRPGAKELCCWKRKFAKCWTPMKTTFLQQNPRRFREVSKR